MLKLCMSQNNSRKCQDTGNGSRGKSCRLASIATKDKDRI